MSRILTDRPVVNTDGHMWISAIDFVPLSGTWTVVKDAISGNTAGLRRTAGASDDLIEVSFRLPSRDTANRGRKITTYDLVYTVSTADCDNVLCILRQLTVPANGAAISQATFAGAVNGDYDTNHDTSTKRKAVGNHTATITCGSPVFEAADKPLILEITCYAASSATSVFDLAGVMLHYTEALVP